MTLRKNLAIALSVVSACLPLSQIHSYLTADLELTNGFRQDRISSLIHSYDSLGNLKGSNSVKVKEFNLYQVGIRNRWNLSNFILRVDGNYGWSDTAKYREVTASGSLPSTKTKASIKEGIVKDITAGGGYLLSISDLCGFPQQIFPSRGRVKGPTWELLVGPVGGFSYHEQYFKTRHARTNGAFDSLLNDLSYRNKWWGPWIGADLKFSLSNLNFNAGYEYHWTSWRGSWKLRHTNLGPFSDHRRTNIGHGNTAYANFYFNFPSYWSSENVNWHLGFGFKYQDLKVIDGHARSSLRRPSQSNDDLLRRVARATWRSYAVTFDIGSSF